MEQKRDEVLDADPLVTPEEALAARRRGGHPPAVHPDAVRGRPRQLLADRGRPADARRHRAQLRQGARRARAPARASTGRRIEDLELVILTHQHIDHLGLVEIVAERSGRRGRGDRRRRRSACANFGDDAERDDEYAGGTDAPLRDPRRRRHRAADRLAQLPRLGRARRGHAPARRRRDARAARPRARGPAPPRAQPLRHRLLGLGPRDPARGRPPDRPHLVEPADDAAARRLGASARRRSSTTSRRCAARASCRPRSSCPATASRSPTTVTLIDERFAMHGRRAEKLLRADRRAARARAYELAQEMWGNVAVTQAFLTLSEVRRPRRPAGRRAACVREVEGDDGDRALRGDRRRGRGRTAG